MVPFADFNLLQLPRPRPGAGEDPRPDDALGHLPDRLPRRLHGRRAPPAPRSYVAGAGPVGLAAAYAAQLLGASVVIVGDMNADRLGAGPELRLRDGRPQLGQRPGRHDRADRRRARGRRGRRRGGLRGQRARGGRRRGAGDGAQRHHDDRAGRRVAGHSRALRDRRPGRRRRERQGRPDRREARPGLGEVALVHHRPVPGQALQPPADEPDPQRTRRRSPRRSTPSGSAWTRRRTPTSASTRARPRSTSSTRTGWWRSAHRVSGGAPAPARSRRPVASTGLEPAGPDGSRVIGATTGWLRRAGPRRPRRCPSSAASPGRSRRRR